MSDPYVSHQLTISLHLISSSDKSVISLSIFRIAFMRNRRWPSNGKGKGCGCNGFGNRVGKTGVRGTIVGDAADIADVVMVSFEC